MDSDARLHAALIGVLHQHYPVCDECQPFAVGLDVVRSAAQADRLFGPVEAIHPVEQLPIGQLAAALPAVVGNLRIDAERLYGPLVVLPGSGKLPPLSSIHPEFEDKTAPVALRLAFSWPGY